MAGSVTGIKAGKAFVLIEAVDATGRVLNSVRQRLGKFGTEMSKIGRTMALRALGALTPVALAVKTGTTYDDIMRKVEARSEGTQAQMATLREQTLKLGKAFGILPTSMGGIQNIFAQAGFSREQIAQIGPAVALLARAGGEATGSFEDTENAAKAVSAILRGFELDADQAGMVVGKLAVALNVSNYNLEDITTSLQYAVRASKEFGVSIDDMLASLGAMRDLQIEASIAGTAFRNMMVFMSKEKARDKFNKDLQALTGNTIEFTDALGNLHKPQAILMAMLKATAGLGTAQRSNLISGILETRATIPGMAIGGASDRMAEMKVRLQNWRGEAERMQKHMDAGLGGAFRRFTSAVEEAAIRIQQALAPALINATAHIDKLVTTATNWVMKNAGVVATVVAATAGFLALGTALVIIGQATLGLSALFGLGAALASATSFLLAFVAPWAAAAAGIYLAMNAVDEFLGASTRDTDVIKAAIQSLLETVFGLGKGFTDVSSSIATEWSNTLKAISSSLSSGDLEGAFKILSTQLQVTWTEVVNSLMDKWDEFIQFIANTRSQLSVSFDEVGARMAALYAYHFEAKAGENRAEVGARAYKEYLAHATGTRAGLLAEAQNSPEAQARRAAKAARDATLAGLQGQLTAARTKPPTPPPGTGPTPPNSTYNPAAAAAEAEKARVKARIEAEAAALIGPGMAAAAVPKSAVEALDRTSTESMKAFTENRYNLSEELLGEIEEHLAAIRGHVEEGGDIGVL